MVVPVIFVVAYVVSLLAGRPLMGLIINPLSGGPRDWRRITTLRRDYTISTLIGMALAMANLLVRVVFYLADQPGILAVVQVASTSVFAVHFAVTFVVTRRRRRSRGHPAGAQPTQGGGGHRQIHREHPAADVSPRDLDLSSLQSVAALGHELRTEGRPSTCW